MHWSTGFIIAPSFLPVQEYWAWNSLTKLYMRHKVLVIFAIFCVLKISLEFSRYFSSYSNLYFYINRLKNNRIELVLLIFFHTLIKICYIIFEILKNLYSIESIFFKSIIILPNCRRNKRIVSSLKVPFAANVKKWIHIKTIIF